MPTPLEQLPAPVRDVFARLQRRLTIGLFLDVWPVWAMTSLFVCGSVVLVCRMFFESAAPYLRWVWLAPLLTAVPAVVICVRRAYRPAEVAALADWLGGGQGLLLTLLEKPDVTWAESKELQRAATLVLPRWRVQRALVAVVPALAFLVVTMRLPQRVPSTPANPALAKQIAADLSAAVAELKQQELISPAEEERLEEEIKRIQQSAEQRVDASSWEAADALREQMAAGLSEKQQALKWAQTSLARYAAAAQTSQGAAGAGAQAAELTKALEKLAQSGLLGGASKDLLKALKDGKLAGDPGAVNALMEALAGELGQMNGKFGDIAALGKEFGRFNPADFPVGSGQSSGDGPPGRGGVGPGGGPADLTWGKETERGGKFTAQALPRGAARSADDWAPVVVLPGAPQESPVLGSQSSAREYAETAGQAAWRRTLAPRHLSAVKKYFGTGKGG